MACGISRAAWQKSAVGMMAGQDPASQTHWQASPIRDSQAYQRNRFPAGHAEFIAEAPCSLSLPTVRFSDPPALLDIRKLYSLQLANLSSSDRVFDGRSMPVGSPPAPITCAEKTSHGAQQALRELRVSRFQQHVCKARYSDAKAFMTPLETCLWICLAVLTQGMLALWGILSRYLQVGCRSNTCFAWVHLPRGGSQHHPLCVCADETRRPNPDAAASLDN